MNRPEIVAELSCNHLGDIDRALALIDAAADAGADAVKVQCWTSDSMVVKRDYIIPEGPWAGLRLADLYDQAKTPWEWMGALMGSAEGRGLKFIASVFDPVSLCYLERLGCPRYKIASFELVDTPLIEAVRDTGKPIILSTGMATEEEIWQAVKAAGLYASPPRDITLLHCVSAYPAPPSSMTLGNIEDLRGIFDVDVGLSDHTLGHTAAVIATAYGATLIEKHFTLLRADGGPDAAFSIEPDELDQLVQAVTEAAQMAQDGPIGPRPSEEPQRALRRSLYWARDITEGETITPDHLTTARPALGLPPAMMQRIIGQKAPASARAGEPITCAT